jgi:hypothetical protein
VDLVDWLARTIHDDSVLPDEKAAFLNSAVTGLIESRGMSLEELNYANFRLRDELEQKFRSAKREAMRKVMSESYIAGSNDNFSAMQDAEKRKDRKN